jgi:hypothetical protein
VHGDRFPVVDVSGWDVISDETSGSEEKYWLEEPETGRRWLFKTVRVRETIIHGEDWAEKAVAEMAGLVRVPCAQIQMAQYRDSRGCISADLRPKLYELQHGQVLLEEVGATGYEHRTGGRSHPGHSVENIQNALSGILPPPGWDLPFDATAFDVFVGYLLLDAWVANKDRHDNNWAVLRPVMSSSRAPTRLCGSYDHASSLGFNVTDDQCCRLLADPEAITRWARRGYADRYDFGPSDRRPTLVDLAARGLSLASGAATEYWRDQFGQVDGQAVWHVLDQIPRMSEPARRFAYTVLDVNRRRVLDAIA